MSRRECVFSTPNVLLVYWCKFLHQYAPTLLVRQQWRGTAASESACHRYQKPQIYSLFLSVLFLYTMVFFQIGVFLIERCGRIFFLKFFILAFEAAGNIYIFVYGKVEQVK